MRDLSPRLDSGGSGRLVLRFALLSLAAITLAFVGTLWFVVVDARRDARGDVISRAGLVATSVVAGGFLPSDLESLSDDQRRALDEAFQRNVLLGNALEAEIVGPD